MIDGSKGKNAEYCDKVIKKILQHWDKTVGSKTTNPIGSNEVEVYDEKTA